MDVEIGLPAKVGIELETEAEVVALWLFLDQYDQRLLAVDLVDRVIDVLEVATTIDAPHVQVDRVAVERLADLGRQRLQDHLRRHPLRALDLDRLDHDGALLRRRGLALAQRRVLLRRQRIAAQLICHFPRCILADRDGLYQIVEVRGREVTELRHDQHIPRRQLLQRAIDVLLGQDVDHLHRDAEHRRDLVGAQQRSAEVYRDDDVGSHRSRNVDRKVAHQPAVDELALVDGDRRNCARHRHRRADRRHHAAALQHDHFPRADVGRNGAEWNRQFVEGCEHCRSAPAAQFTLERHARHDALGQHDAVLADTELRDE